MQHKLQGSTGETERGLLVMRAEPHEENCCEGAGVSNMEHYPYTVCFSAAFQLYFVVPCLSLE